MAFVVETGTGAANATALVSVSTVDSYAADRGLADWEAAEDAAKQKAIQRGIDAAFEVQDALSLQDLDRRFDTIIDCGLFHTFSDEDRPKYVASLAKVTNPDGRILLLCFSENEPEGQGPRRVTQAEIHDNFSDGWEVESIEPARFKTRTDIEGVSFSEGGPHAWFAKIRRD